MGWTKSPVRSSAAGSRGRNRARRCTSCSRRIQKGKPATELSSRVSVAIELPTPGVSQNVSWPMAAANGYSQAKSLRVWLGPERPPELVQAIERVGAALVDVTDANVIVWSSRDDGPPILDRLL